MPKICQKTRLEPPKQHEGWTIRFYFSTTNHFDPSLLGKKTPSCCWFNSHVFAELRDASLYRKSTYLFHIDSHFMDDTDINATHHQLPSGKRLHNYGKSPFCSWAIHYFYGHVQ
jgi:hypothetical protein